MSETSAEAAAVKKPGDKGKRIIIAVIILAAVGVTLLQLKSPSLDKRWGSDLETALDTAGKTGRPVIVFLRADPPSHDARRMIKETFPNAQTTRALSRGNWLCVQLALGEKLQSPHAGRFKLAALPAVVLLAPDGKELAKASGFIGHADMTKMMEDAREKAGPVAGASRGQ